MVIALNSVDARDEWILKIRSLIDELAISKQSIRSLSTDESTQIEPKRSRDPAASNGLSCLGITIIKESKLAKLNANQPTFLSNSNSETDSLLNEICTNLQQRCKLVENIFPGKDCTI